MHCCATLTYPPSFVFLVTAVKVVTQHSPSLIRWMSSATSASPDEARKEWRRGRMMFLFHGARFRTGRNFLICNFFFFFTSFPVSLIFWIGPSTFFPFSHGKVSKKVWIIYILMLGLIYSHWSCEPKLAPVHRKRRIKVRLHLCSLFPTTPKTWGDGMDFSGNEGGGGAGN